MYTKKEYRFEKIISMIFSAHKVLNFTLIIVTGAISVDITQSLMCQVQLDMLQETVLE